MSAVTTTSHSPAPAGACGCPEFLGADVSRRGFLRGLGVAGASFTVGSAVVSMGRSAAAADATGNVVVVLSLRGAADGLSLVVPHGDPVYYQARPRIAVAADQLLVRDDFFGLNPALKALVPLWTAGKVAAVHATGMAVPNRSHFAAMELVEDAAPGSTQRIGWLNRLLGELPGSSPLQGLAVGDTPGAFYGPEPIMGFRRLDRVGIAGDDKWDPTGERVRSLGTMWGSSRNPLAPALRAAMAAVEDIAPAQAQADRTSSYPNTDLAKALSSVSRTIRGDVGVSLVTVDQGDWDMHTDIGTLSWGRMRTNASQLAEAIAAFFTDLGPHADRVTLVTVSEFGRRVVENDNYGTDHGWGNVMFLVGAGVKGGYHGSWPGLVKAHDADLAVTTDYRSVLAEVVRARTTASTAAVFPGFSPARVGAMVGQ